MKYCLVIKVGIPCPVVAHAFNPSLDEKADRSLSLDQSGLQSEGMMKMKYKVCGRMLIENVS